MKPQSLPPLRFLLLAPLLLLTGCLVVEDFGPYWKTGEKDPCLNLIAWQYFLEQNEHSDELEVARVLALGAHRFMMLKEKPEALGGTLYRYAVQHGQFITYRLNEDKREEFMREFPNTGIIITDETVTIPYLNEATLGLLGTITERPDYWVEAERFPYNPGRLAGCHEAEEK